MILSEVEFNKLNTVDIFCSKFSENGKAIKHKCTLYPMEVLTAENALKGFYIEAVKYNYYTDYVVWNDCGGIIAVKYLSFDEEQDISEITEIMHRNMEFKGTDGYKKLLSKRETNGAYINMAEIYALQLLGETELSIHYSTYRENFLALRAQKEQELEKQRQLDQQKKEADKQKAFEDKIAEAKNCIKENRLLKNDLLDDGKHLILYLMKRYNINIPLKTQGWINNKLASVVFNKDDTITVYFLRSKGCKCPQSIYKYLGLLKTAVREDT